MHRVLYLFGSSIEPNMRVIIAGAGQVGRGIASALRGEKRSVAIIDPNPEAITGISVIGLPFGNWKCLITRLTIEGGNQRC